MWNMVQKIKDNAGVFTYRTIMASMSGVILFFLIRVNNKVEFSYDFNQKQNEKNNHFKEELMRVEKKIDNGMKTLVEMYDNQSMKIDKITIHYYELKSDMNKLPTP